MALARKKVLVLNKTWSPVGVIGLKRAIGLLFSMYANGQPKALVVETESFATMTWNDWAKLMPEHEDEVIRSPRKDFKIPEVIVLTQYDKLPSQKVTFSRRTIYKRDNQKCQYCGKLVGNEGTLDHIVPRSRGGLSTWTNVVLSCVGCNTKKANKLLKECGMKLLREPQKPKYQLFKSEGIMCRSWKKFISTAFWEVELVNDNP